MIANLKDDDLAAFLAVQLSDYEFEMLVRMRIKRLFEGAEDRHQELSDSHHSCHFSYSWGDESEWRVSLGSTYRDHVDTKGQVLGVTLANCERQWYEQKENKLSLLLPAPKPGFTED